MKKLYPGDFCEVEINWSELLDRNEVIDNGCHHDKDSSLYAIVGKYSSSEPKLLYIGKAFEQDVSKRLNQGDHKVKYNKIREQYPRHRIYVSYGKVSIPNGKRTRNRIDDLEKILIYSCCAEHSINRKNFLSHGVSSQYLIRNESSFSFFPKKLALGIFES